MGLFLRLGLSVLVSWLSLVSAEWGVVTPCGFAVEMMFLQDFSNSFTDDRATLAGQLVDLMDAIDGTYPESRMGFATFVDKPLEPFGYPYQGPWFEGDWCLNMTHALDHGETNADAVDQLMNSPAGGGNDWAENQLGAMHDLARGNSAGWSSDLITPNGKFILRMLVVSTDSTYHIAGHGAVPPWFLPANDGSEETICDGEDYPTIAQVRDALLSRNIYTVFLVGNSTTEDVYSVYDELLGLLGTPGGVYNISSDSSDLLDTMEGVFEDLEDEICNVAVDMMFVQDVTWSYSNDMGGFQSKMDNLMESMLIHYASPRFGLASFGDKPLPPLGHGPSGDYCYRLGCSLTNDTALVNAAAAELVNVSGLDWRESQLDALITTALETAVGWRPGNTWNGLDLVRVMVLATDAGFHRTPHAANAGYALDPHDGGPINDTLCVTQEYPTWEQAAQALVDADVNPIFVPTSDIKSIYQTLRDNIEDVYGLAGGVVELANWSDFVIPTIESINQVAKTVRKERRIQRRALRQ